MVVLVDFWVCAVVPLAFGRLIFYILSSPLTFVTTQCGEFIGGSDIMIEMYQSGELGEMIEKVSPIQKPRCGNDGT